MQRGGDGESGNKHRAREWQSKNIIIAIGTPTYHSPSLLILPSTTKPHTPMCLHCIFFSLRLDNITYIHSFQYLYHITFLFQSIIIITNFITSFHIILFRLKEKEKLPSHHFPMFQMDLHFYKKAWIIITQTAIAANIVCLRRALYSTMVIIAFNPKI